MVEIVYGEHAVSEPIQQLIRVLEKENLSGTLYIGYPILSSTEGAIPVDALYVSKESGVVIFETDNLASDPQDPASLTEITSNQDRYYSAISAKLYDTPELLVRRDLSVNISIIGISINHSFANEDGVLLARIEEVPDLIPRDNDLTDTRYRVLNSVIERTATIRPKKKRANVEKKGSKGAVLRQIEQSIANLDAWQKRAAIESPNGPQRIRGLAGSGKTIVLALKAAYLHTREPDWRIVLTFQTRSLYQQFRRLVRQFCFEFAKEEPDWTKLTILHAWGGYSSAGVYAEIAKAAGLPIRDFNYGKDRFGAGNAFKGVCDELLDDLKGNFPRPLFDAVLIDEAQDLPQSFFELVYHTTSPPKRIVYAYDELQNLQDFTILPPEDLFGKKKNGHPNVRLKNEADKPRQDIVLRVCYRNAPWALTTAHGLGFGTAREQGLIQMFDDPQVWREIGYDVKDGELAHGREVALARSEAATPGFFKKLLVPEDAVQFHAFENTLDEFEWVAKQIKQNVTEDELDLDDILVVIPEAITIRSTAPRVMSALRKQKVKAHLVGVSTTRDEVFSKDSVAITSIYRAKGNEAPMVYVVGAEYCQSGFNLARKRNILFTAITRSRAWVRISGVKSAVAGLMGEYESIRQQQFALEFQYPTVDQLRRLRTVHRDWTVDEIGEFENDLAAMMRVIEKLERGEMSIDALPPQAQQRIRRLQNDARKSADSN